MPRDIVDKFTSTRIRTYATTRLAEVQDTDVTSGRRAVSASQLLTVRLSYRSTQQGP